jgi:hypothetical protein
VKKQTVLFLDSSTGERKGCSLPWKEHRTYKTSPAKGQWLPAAASWVRPIKALCLIISGQRRLNWREQANALIEIRDRETPFMMVQRTKTSDGNLQGYFERAERHGALDPASTRIETT